MATATDWTIEKLTEHLEGAVELELLVIPPYMCALYSLHPGSNEEAALILRSILVEEMLHMVLAANVLNAIGGHPLTAPHHGWVPCYPSAIPYHEPKEVKVGLQPFGDDAIELLLAIEHPSYPVATPPAAPPEAAVPRATRLAREEGYNTIGAFYAAIEEGLQTLNKKDPDKLFTGQLGYQVGPEHYYASGGRAIVVHDLATALQALDEVVEQGEGEATKPAPGEKFDEDRDLAHYYRVDELRRRRRYLANDDPGKPTGAEIELDLTAVYPMQPGLVMADLPAALRAAATTCNDTYSRLLDQVQAAFNGQPEVLKAAVATMFDLKYAAIDLLRTPLGDGSGMHAGPAFEYSPQAKPPPPPTAAVDARRGLPPIAPHFNAAPFHYASLAVMEVLYRVDPQPLDAHLAGSGLEVATFADGTAAAGFNFQMYTTMFAGSMETIMEIELNVLACPSGCEQPLVSFEDWVMGADQSKLIGSYRVHVPCDDDIAIEAGKKLYGEPKFKTRFIVDFPVANSAGGTTWSFTCCDPAHPPAGDDADARAHAIFSCSARLGGLDAILSNPSPITVYGSVTVSGPDHGKPVGARWNILRPFETYFLPPTLDAPRVELGYGESSHEMQADVKEMIGSATAAVVRTTISPPAAIQSRTYWP